MYCADNSHFLLSVQGNKLPFYKESFKLSGYTGFFEWKNNRKVMVSNLIVKDNNIIINESIRMDRNLPFLNCYYLLNIKCNETVIPYKDPMNIPKHIKILLESKNDTHITECNCCKNE
jgi:hypothetical protein